MVQLESTNHDLRQLADHARKNSPIFVSTEQAILSDLQNLKSTIYQPDFLHTFLFYLFGACAGISLILVILLGAKVKYLAAATLIAKAPATAMAITVRSLDFFATTPSIAPNITKVQPTHIVMDLHQNSTLPLLIFAILLIICGLRQHRNLTNSKFTIELHLGNNTQLTKLSIMTLPHAVCNYKFQADTFVQSIHVSGSLFPSLHLFWPALVITHRLTKQTYTIPSSIHITPITAYKIRKLTIQPYWLLLVSNDSRQVNILPLQGTLWDSTISPREAHVSCPTLNHSITGSQEEIV